MTDPICKIARENGGTVPLSCAFKCHRGCLDDGPDEPQAVSCRSCGADDLYWQDTWTASGQRHPRLYEDGKPHVCKPTTDDFDEVRS